MNDVFRGPYLGSAVPTSSPAAARLLGARLRGPERARSGTSCAVTVHLAPMRARGRRVQRSGPLVLLTAGTDEVVVEGGWPRPAGYLVDLAAGATQVEAPVHLLQRPRHEGGGPLPAGHYRLHVVLELSAFPPAGEDDDLGILVSEPWDLSVED